MLQNIELLAPAGGMPQLIAALRFGADAVYGALPAFGLRAFAGNFTWEELQQGITVLHNHGKKFYLTLNAMPYDNEMDEMVATARRACEMGVDAAIVSDLGAFLRLRRDVPQLNLHISTQANTLNSEAVRFYHSMGAERVVLARELSMERIAALRQNIPADMQLEAFVHGAMCMSYSGRCLLSDHLTGRHGNKGACAQPCRWSYTIHQEKHPGLYVPIEEDERGTYLLSSYDLCMISHLPALLNAGICSLKIEGRMKTEYYVATVVGAYRRALDTLLNNGQEAYAAMLPALEEELGKASHRVYHTGFYFGQPSPAGGSPGCVQNMEYTARVEGWENGIATLLLKNRFFVGDTLELLTPQGVFPIEITQIAAEDGRLLQAASVPGQIIRVPIAHFTAQGDFLRGPNRNHQTN